jgi:hypothetical protein
LQISLLNLRPNQATGAAESWEEETQNLLLRACMANFKDEYPLPFALFREKKNQFQDLLCVGSNKAFVIQTTSPLEIHTQNA